MVASEPERLTGKILVSNVWYTRLAPHAIYEQDFERILQEKAPLLFPEYTMIPFKKLLQSPTGDRRGDFALVHRSYREWWVVEVEMSTHPLFGHVVPQVEGLAGASYGESEAEYLNAHDSGLDLGRLKEMMLGRAPSVLVIVNAPTAGWKMALQPYGALLKVAEVYRSILNQHLLYVSGDDLPGPSDVVSVCRYDPVLLQFLIVESPASLGFSSGEVVDIRYRDGISSWVRFDSGDTVWLRPHGPAPRMQGAEIELVRLEDGSLVFEESRVRRRKA